MRNQAVVCLFLFIFLVTGPWAQGQDCPAGMQWVTEIQMCERCWPGTYKPSSGPGPCLPCPKGEYTVFEFQISCQPCPKGTFSSETGATQCVNCPPGTYSDQPGAEQCTECASGTYNPATGQAACFGCPQSESPGQTTCGAAVCDPTELGAYKCWTAKDRTKPKFVKLEDVQFDDEFAGDLADIKSPRLYCSPASVDGSEVVDPEASLCCYSTESSKLKPPAEFLTEDQFGTLEIEIKNPNQLLCVPCSKLP